MSKMYLMVEKYWKQVCCSQILETDLMVDSYAENWFVDRQMSETKLLVGKYPKLICWLGNVFKWLVDKRMSQTYLAKGRFQKLIWSWICWSEKSEKWFDSQQMLKNESLVEKYQKVNAENLFDDQ